MFVSCFLDIITQTSPLGSDSENVLTIQSCKIVLNKKRKFIGLRVCELIFDVERKILEMKSRKDK
jgi:hypothetical protein